MSGVVAIVLWAAFSVWVVLGVTRDVLRSRRMLRHGIQARDEQQASFQLYSSRRSVMGVPTKSPRAVSPAGGMTQRSAVSDEHGR